MRVSAPLLGSDVVFEMLELVAGISDCTTRNVHVVTRTVRRARNIMYITRLVMWNQEPYARLKKICMYLNILLCTATGHSVFKFW